MKKMPEKIKRIIISAAIVLVCAVVSVALYMSQMQGVSQKALKLYVNGIYGGGRITLNEENIPSQLFTPTTDIFHFGTVLERDLGAKGQVTLNLYRESSGELIASSTLGFDKLIGTVSFFEDINYTLNKGDRLRAEFTTEYDEDSEGSLYLQRSDVVFPTDSVLTVNGEEVQGTIVIVCASDKLGDSFTYIYFVLCALMAALLVLVYNLAFYGKLPFHKLVLAALVSLGLIFGFILPAYSAPDEAIHINQAFSTSSYILGGVGYDELKASVNYRRPSDENAIFSSRITTPFTYREIVDNLFSTTEDAAASSVQRTDERSITSGIDLAHLPAALVITLCRLIHLGYVPTVMLGRLACFALFALCVYFSVKNTPFGKTLFAVIAMLPMCLHLGYSYSYDMPALGLSLLVLAFCLKYAYTEKRFSWRSLLLLAVAAGVLSMLKSIYIFIPLAFLIVPKERFADLKWKKLARPAFFVIVLLLSSLAKGSFLSIVINQLKSVAATPQTVVETVAAVSAEGADAAAAAAPAYYSLSYILHNITQTIYLLCNTFVENIQFYLESMLGTAFGYYDTTVSGVWFAALCLLLFAAALNNPEEKTLGTKTKLNFLLLSLFVAVAAVLGAITWTTTDAAVIYGLQGRYILPVLLPALLCLKSDRISLKADIKNALVFAVCAVDCGIMLNLLLTVTKR